MTWEDKHHQSRFPPLLLLPTICILCMVPRDLEYPFGYLGSPVLSLSPPSLPHTLVSSPAGGVPKAEKAVVLGKPYTATAETSLYY